MKRDIAIAVVIQLAIMVLRWCDATWIEDQDHWNHAGLHRSVFLESRGGTHVRDLIVDTDFDPASRTGSAAVTVEVSGASAGWRARARLEGPDGQISATGPETAIEQFDTSAPTGAQWAQSYAFRAYAARFELQITDAMAWSAEVPSRYRLIVELCDADGAVKRRRRNCPCQLRQMSAQYFRTTFMFNMAILDYDLPA